MTVYAATILQYLSGICSIELDACFVDAFIPYLFSGYRVDQFANIVNSNNNLIAAL